MAERVGRSGMRSASLRARMLGAVLVSVLVAASGCAGGSDDSAAADSPSASTTDRGDGELFEPVDQDDANAAAPVPGTAVELDDDVIIATDDGEVPPSSTEPPVDPDGPDAPPSSTTGTVDAVPLPAPDAVQRIVSLSPTHTEILFALGLGEFVVAVDAESDFPVEAQAVRRDDLVADTADLSTLLALDPDVVIVGDDPTGTGARLNAAGVAVFVGPPATSLDDVYDQIRGVAAIVGRSGLADDLVESMQDAIDGIVASLPAGRQVTYFHEIDPSLVTVAPGSLIDELYGELGMVSIAPPDPSGFPQLTADRVLAADPDVIVLADAECCAVTAEVISRRAGWSALSAVTDGAVVEVTDDLVERWGPRVVELLRLVAGGVAAAS